VDRVSQAVRDQYTRFPYPSSFHSVVRRLERLPSPLRRPLVRRVQRLLIDERGVADIVMRLFPQGLAGRRILDAGCGTGEILTSLARAFPTSHVTGVDLSPESLRLARWLVDHLELTNVELEEGNLLDLPVDLQSFDLITSMGVLHTLADPAEGLRRLAERIAPGGYLVVYLYSSIGRFDRICKREALSILVPDDSGFEEKLGYVDDLKLALLPRRGAIRRLRRWLTRDLLGLDTPSIVVDQMAHVKEWNYTAEEVLQLIDHAGLSFVRFAGQMPNTLAEVTSSASVLSRAKALDPLQRYRLIELLVRPMGYTIVARPKG